MAENALQTFSVKTDPATDLVKQRIVNKYPLDNIEISNLKKVVGHKEKTVKIGPNPSLRGVLTLDDERQVVFSERSSVLYIVSKTDNGTNAKRDTYDTYLWVVDDGSIFENYDIYVDVETTDSKNNVYVIKPEEFISGGGSRKKYRKSSRRVTSAKKSSRRVTSAKKSSRSRKFRNRK